MGETARPSRPEATTVSVEGVTPAVEPVVSTFEVDDGGVGGDPFRVALVAVPEGPATMQLPGPAVRDSGRSPLRTIPPSEPGPGGVAPGGGPGAGP